MQTFLMTHLKFIKVQLILSKMILKIFVHLHLSKTPHKAQFASIYLIKIIILLPQIFITVPSVRIWANVVINIFIVAIDLWFMTIDSENQVQSNSQKQFFSLLQINAACCIHCVLTKWSIKNCFLVFCIFGNF